jgi:hypothetical protein
VRLRGDVEKQAPHWCFATKHHVTAAVTAARAAARSLPLFTLFETQSSQSLILLGYEPKRELAAARFGTLRLHEPHAETHAFTRLIVARRAYHTSSHS